MRCVELRDAQDGQWYRFSDPVELVEVWSAEHVCAALDHIDQRVQQDQLWAVGMITYEAAAGLDAALQVHEPCPDLPLLCFGLYRTRVLCDAIKSDGASADVSWQPFDAAQYGELLGQVRHDIGNGDYYQLNLTVRWQGQDRLPPDQAHGHWLSMARSAPYGAWLRMQTQDIYCASPELFVCRQNGVLTSRPMKGTAARGTTLAADQAQQLWLAQSEKNRAENLMITDMVRNDLGRIAQPGSVCVHDLFALTKYPSVWQMTSTVSARSDAGLRQILCALFPAASITGAPKAASMARIKQLEDSPRGIYTGTIGFVAPDGQAQFNVAIRTLVRTRDGGALSYGVGGGLVWDSQAQEEVAEIQTKTRVLQQHQTPPLLETMRWQPDTGYVLLPGHLQRLADSACYFDYPFDAEAVRRALSDAAQQFPQQTLRVRLILDRQGQMQISHQALYLSDEIVRLSLAPLRVDSENPLLYHKTTQRQLYAEAAAAVAADHEALLLNQHDHITESVIANLVYVMHGRSYTPPLTDGVLPGVMRADLLARGEIIERSLALAEISQVSEWFLINALRGWRKAQLHSVTQAALR